MQTMITIIITITIIIIIIIFFYLQTVSYYPPKNRNLPNPDFESLVPSTALMASIFWMLVTWCLWFLPDILPPTVPEEPCRTQEFHLQTKTPIVFFVFVFFYVLQLRFLSMSLMWFALTFDLPSFTWPKRHGPGAVRPQRHGSALLPPAHLQDRPGRHQGDGGGEEDGEEPWGTLRNPEQRAAAWLGAAHELCVSLCVSECVGVGWSRLPGPPDLLHVLHGESLVCCFVGFIPRVFWVWVEMLRTNQELVKQ